MMGNSGMMGGPDIGIFGMILGLIFTLLFLVGFVLLIVWVVKQLTPGGTGTAAPPSTNNALDILKERFAKGEISKDEFTEMKKELMK